MDLPADFTWSPRLLGPGEAAEQLSALVAETPWEDHALSMFGREVPMPRRIAWYGPFSYAYSGVFHPARPLTPRLVGLCGRIEAATGLPFNSVLLNLYRDGNASVGWHSDDDYPNGGQPAVASLSLGATRRFRVAPKKNRTGGPFSIDLEDGGLLVMVGRSQLDWRHCLPRTSQPVGPRVNLTFRQVAAS